MNIKHFATKRLKLELQNILVPKLDLNHDVVNRMYTLRNLHFLQRLNIKSGFFCPNFHYLLFTKYEIQKILLQELENKYNEMTNERKMMKRFEKLSKISIESKDDFDNEYIKTIQYFYGGNSYRDFLKIMKKLDNFEMNQDETSIFHVVSTNFDQMLEDYLLLDIDENFKKETKELIELYKKKL
jgi:hypothetical protein